MKTAIVLSLLSLWIFALVAPSIVTIVEKSGSSFVFNLNEEEQKESVSWDADKKVISRQFMYSVFLSQSENVANIPTSLTTIPDPLFEVYLPPPEQKSFLLLA